LAALLRATILYAERLKIRRMAAPSTNRLYEFRGADDVSRQDRIELVVCGASPPDQ
jgi:hypothetical protein